MRLPSSSTVPKAVCRYKNASASGKITNIRAGIISADTVIFDSFSPDLEVRSASELSVTIHFGRHNFVV